MTDGEPEIDPHGSDIARFYDHQRTATTSRRARPRATTRPTASSTRWSSGPRTGTSGSVPFNDRERELGAVFFETAGWERPFWYESNAAAARGVRRPGDAARRPSGNRAGGRRSSTPSTWPCATGSGMVDLSAFAIFDVSGPGRARPTSSAWRCTRWTCRSGRVVYTPLLNAAGGIKADLTIMRLGDRPVPGRHRRRHGHARPKWFADHLPADGSAQLHDATSAWTTVGVWGPARAGRGRVADLGRRLERGLPVRHRRSRSRSARSALSPRGSPTSASSAGRSTSPIEQGRARLGHPVGGRPAARARAGRDRRLRRHRLASRRATAPTAPSSSSTTTWSRPAWPGRR